MILYVIYVPRTPTLTSIQSPSRRPDFHVAVTVATLCLAFFLTTLGLSIVVELWYPKHLQLLANCFGVTSAVLASVQYFPQIYTTFQLRCVGSLSIPMMCIQTPGSFVWAASLAARVGLEGWSTWGVPIVSAMLQGSLLVMGVYFEYIRPLKSGEDTPSSATPTAEIEEGTGRAPDENTPLLREGNTS